MPTTCYAQLDDAYGAALMWNTDPDGQGDDHIPIAGDTRDLNGHAVLLTDQLVVPAGLITNVSAGGLLVVDEGATVVVNAAITASSRILTLNDDTALLTINGFFSVEDWSAGYWAVAVTEGEVIMTGGAGSTGCISPWGGIDVNGGTLTLSGPLCGDAQDVILNVESGGTLVLGTVSVAADEQVHIQSIGSGNTIDVSGMVCTNLGRLYIGVLAGGTLTVGAGEITEGSAEAQTCVLGGALEVTHYTADAEAAAAAAQLVTDKAAVDAAKGSIKDDATILTIDGEYDFTAAIAAGFAAGQIDQLATDVAAVEAKADKLQKTQSILGVDGTLAKVIVDADGAATGFTSFAAIAASKVVYADAPLILDSAGVCYGDGALSAAGDRSTLDSVLVLAGGTFIDPADEDVRAGTPVGVSPRQGSMGNPRVVKVGI